MTTGRANQDDAPLGATVTQAAELLGVTRRTLYRWRDKGWLVHHPDGGVDVEATRTKVQANADPARSPTACAIGRTLPQAKPDTSAVQATIDALDSLPNMELAEARRLKEVWTSELRRMEVQEKKGELISIEDVERAWGEVTTAIRSRFQSVPSRQVDALLSAGFVASGTTRATVETILCALVDEVLSDLADNPPGIE